MALLLVFVTSNCETAISFYASLHRICVDSVISLHADSALSCYLSSLSHVYEYGDRKGARDPIKL